MLFRSRLGWCFLKGGVGNALNLMLAGAAWNPRKWLRTFSYRCSGGCTCTPGTSLTEAEPHASASRSTFSRMTN